MTWLIVTVSFMCGFILDLVWTLCIDAVTRRKALTAANLSAILYLCTFVSTVLIVEKCFLALTAYIVGGWLGTYVVVKRKQ
jgi:hypothetical protein